MNLQNKVVLITGASSGIGKELARAFAYEKSKLALIARRKNVLDDISKGLIATETRINIYECDVSKRRDVIRTIEKINSDFGKIDIAVLNSGIGYRMDIEDFSSEKAKQTFDTNFMGIVYFVEALIPYFKERREGIIAGVSSLADSRGYPKSGFYCASKAAVSVFLESLRIELKPFNVKVITVKPGFVKTPMTDKNKFKMPFLMQADQSARIILQGIEKEKKIIQFPLPTVLGSKLIKIMPDFLFDFFNSRQLSAEKN